MPAYRFFVTKIQPKWQVITVWTNEPLEEGEGIPPELEEEIVDKAIKKDEWYMVEDSLNRPLEDFEVQADEVIEDVDSPDDLDIRWEEHDKETVN